MSTVAVAGFVMVVVVVVAAEGQTREEEQLAKLPSGDDGRAFSPLSPNLA